MLFMVAAIINTARWYQLGKQLLTGLPLTKVLSISVFIISAYYLTLVVVNYIIFCSESLESARKTFFELTSISFLVIHIVLILLNTFLMYLFRLRLKRQLPILYQNLK